MTLEVSPDITPQSVPSPTPLRSRDDVRDAYRWAELGERALQDDRLQAEPKPPKPVQPNPAGNAH